MGCCRKRVYEVTKLLDVLMHKSIGTRSPSLSEPVAQFIEKVDLLLKGRCREQKVVSQLSARMQGFSILFIKQLMLGSEQIMEHNLLLPSLNDFFTVRRSFTSELEALAQLLLTQKENNGPFLIICGDKVEDEAVHLLSNTGIFLV